MIPRVWIPREGSNRGTYNLCMFSRRRVCTSEVDHVSQARSAVSLERKIRSRVLNSHRLTSPSLAIVASSVRPPCSAPKSLLTHSQSVLVVPWSWRVPYPVSSPTASSVSSSGPVSNYTALSLPSLTPNHSLPTRRRTCLPLCESYHVRREGHTLIDSQAVNGSFVHWTHRFIDPAAGTACGWNYACAHA